MILARKILDKTLVLNEISHAEFCRRPITLECRLDLVYLSFESAAWETMKISEYGFYLTLERNYLSIRNKYVPHSTQSII